MSKIENLILDIREFAINKELKNFDIEVVECSELGLTFINHNIENIEDYPEFEMFIADKMDQYFYSISNFDVSIGYDYGFAEECKKLNNNHSDLETLVEGLLLKLEDSKDLIIDKIEISSYDVKTPLRTFVEKHITNINQYNLEKDYNQIKIPLPKKFNEGNKIFIFKPEKQNFEIDAKDFENIKQQQEAA